MNNEYQHQPVLLEEVIQHLEIQSQGFYIDATFGRGGHSQAILQRLNSEGRLMALDRDAQAVAYAKATFTDPRFSIEHAAFSQLGMVVKNQGWEKKVAGILFDLGVSSPQLDDPTRGFSFLREGPLDMRMDNRESHNAQTWIAHASVDEMADVFKTYGEERFAKRIAHAIFTERLVAPITTTTQLALIIKNAHPRWEPGQHPATRCFQAIRIFINKELEEITNVLSQALQALAVGGRLAVISFHSLEDRIVKRFMRSQAKGDNFPLDLPVRQSEINPALKVIGRAIRASEKEVKCNPRSRSAVLRIAEKLR